MVSSLYVNSSIPSYIIPQAVSSVNEITECVAAVVKQDVVDALTKLPSYSSLPDVITHVEQAVESVSKPLDLLSTKHKQDNFFANHPLFVPAETISLGCRYEVRAGENCMVYDSYEYVSVEKTLRSLLYSREYVQLLLRDRQTDCDLMSCFSHGERFKQHFLYGDSSKFSLSIQLFYDGLGKTNPLRGNTVAPP